MDKFLRVADVSGLLGVSRITVYKWCENGILPHYRFHKSIRFDLREIKAFINAGRRGLAKAKAGDGPEVTRWPKTDEPEVMRIPKTDEPEVTR